MKIKIRQGCFETNSSSQHSICFMKQDKPITKESFNNEGEYLYLHDGVLDFSYHSDDLYFERYPFNILSSFRDKLMYVIASVCGGYYNEKSEEEFEHILSIVKEINPNIKEIKLPQRIVPVWVDEDGNEIDDDEVWEEDNNFYYFDENDNKIKLKEEEVTHKYENIYGAVDHQSANLLKDFLVTHDLTIKDFLSNGKYIVVIDGDEYLLFEKMKKSGLINTENIREEFL